MAHVRAAQAEHEETLYAAERAFSCFAEECSISVTGYVWHRVEYSIITNGRGMSSGVCMDIFFIFF
jgi:hypothetical protein